MINKYVIQNIIVTIAISLFFQMQIHSQVDSLMKKMNAESIDVLLVIQSQSIDEYPMWSPLSDFIAYNSQGKWHKIDLNTFSLRLANYNNITIGVLDSKQFQSKLKSKEKAEYSKVSDFNERKLITDKNVVIELKKNGFTSSLLVNGHVIMESGDSCHSLVLSPDGKYVAFISEMTGLFILKI